MTKICKIEQESIAEAIALLKSGEVVAIPTETVYGLGAIGTNGLAVKKIFEIKGRPNDNPLICHVHKDFDLEQLVEIEQDYVNRLIEKFTPGPLTLVFKSKGVICDEAVCGGQTLAIRIPSHEGCQQLLKSLNQPVVAPSANLSKHTSPVTAEHVYNDLNGKIELILDGGKCSGGIESTVLDVTSKTPRILRAGLITKEMIESVVGACEVAKHVKGEKVISPGVKYQHYRPKCQTALFEYNQLDQVIKLYQKLVNEGKTPFVLCDDKTANLLGVKNVLNLGKTDLEIASNLYDKLLEGEKKADIIIAVCFDREDGVYMGITNRLRKSCQ